MPTIDERCYGYQPATNQLNELRADLTQAQAEANVRGDRVVEYRERWQKAEERLAKMEEAAQEMFDKLYHQTCGCPSSHDWGEHIPTPPLVVKWRAALAATQPEAKKR